MDERTQLLPDDIREALTKFPDNYKEQSLESLKGFYKLCQPHYANRFNLVMQDYFTILLHNQVYMEIERREGKRK